MLFIWKNKKKKTKICARARDYLGGGEGVRDRKAERSGRGGNVAAGAAAGAAPATTVTTAAAVGAAVGAAAAAAGLTGGLGVRVASRGVPAVLTNRDACRRATLVGDMGVSSEEGEQIVTRCC